MSDNGLRDVHTDEDHWRELLHSLPHRTREALVAWWLDALTLEDLCYLYDWFSLEQPVSNGCLTLVKH